MSDRRRLVSDIKVGHYVLLWPPEVCLDSPSINRVQCPFNQTQLSTHRFVLSSSSCPVTGQAACIVRETNNIVSARTISTDIQRAASQTDRNINAIAQYVALSTLYKIHAHAMPRYIF